MHNAIITMLIGDALLLFLYDRLVVSREDKKGSGIMRYESHGHIAAQPHGITNAIWPDLEKRCTTVGPYKLIGLLSVQQLCAHDELKRIW